MASCERLEDLHKEMKTSAREFMKSASKLQHELECMKLQDNIDPQKRDISKEIIDTQYQVTNKSKDLIIAAQAMQLDDCKRQTPGRGQKAQDDSGCFSVDSAFLRESTGSDDLNVGASTKNYTKEEVSSQGGFTGNLIAQCTEIDEPAESEA